MDGSLSGVSNRPRIDSHGGTPIQNAAAAHEVGRSPPADSAGADCRRVGKGSGARTSGRVDDERVDRHGRRVEDDRGGVVAIQRDDLRLVAVDGDARGVVEAAVVEREAQRDAERPVGRIEDERDADLGRRRRPGVDVEPAVPRLAVGAAQMDDGRDERLAVRVEEGDPLDEQAADRAARGRRVVPQVRPESWRECRGHLEQQHQHDGSSGGVEQTGTEEERCCLDDDDCGPAASSPTLGTRPRRPPRGTARAPTRRRGPCRQTRPPRRRPRRA
mmetsp:Transcript_17290/g.69525  ORF Transcript_17290/g.69525 Transcript_17290/m.69525 type:complete len:274 (+) Transcript_17290:192-1013(+)